MLMMHLFVQFNGAFSCFCILLPIFTACSPRIRMSTINQSRPLSRAVWRARAAVSQAAVQIVHRLLNSVKRYPKNVKRAKQKRNKEKQKNTMTCKGLRSQEPGISQVTQSVTAKTEKESGMSQITKGKKACAVGWCCCAWVFPLLLLPRLALPTLCHLA